MNVEYKFEEFNFDKFSGFVKDLISKYGMREIRFKSLEYSFVTESQRNHLGSVDNPETFLYVWNKNMNEMRVVKFELFKKEGGLPRVEITFDLNKKTITLDELMDISAENIKESLVIFFEIELTQEELSVENSKLRAEIMQVKEVSEKDKADLLNLHQQEKENIENVWKEKNESQKKEFEIKSKTFEDAKNAEIILLNEENSNLKIENENKQRQIDLQETKKLAKAFEDQKIEYKDNSDTWYNRLTVVVLLLILSTALSFFILGRVIWHERLEYYFIDFILISAIWFCAKQYSYYISLYSDFANRQALAQSYYNIINNEEDSIIKSKFIEKTTDVLCMHNNVEHKDNLPVEKILNSTLEITKEAIKKLP